MLETIKQRLERDEDQGFTLIELMVVVLIIAILLAIAIPTFLGAKSSANARAAQSDVRNALTAEQTVFTNSSNQTFSATVATLQTAEPNLGWMTTAPTSTSTNGVGVFLGTSTSAGDTVYLEAYGKDGNCYIVQQVNDPNWVATSTNGPATGYGIVKGTCVSLTGSPAPTAVTAGNAVVGGSATTLPTFYSQW